MLIGVDNSSYKIENDFSLASDYVCMITVTG